MGKVVYVVDAWNDSTQTSVIAVFATKEKARRELERLLKRPGEWYAGVVKRTRSADRVRAGSHRSVAMTSTA